MSINLLDWRTLHREKENESIQSVKCFFIPKAIFMLYDDMRKKKFVKSNSKLNDFLIILDYAISF